MGLQLSDLKAFEPRHSTFVGIDSDGCVFDTPAVKERRFFHPQIIRRWGLERCADALVACGDFTMLFSRSRGVNRFQGLLATLELFMEYPGVRESGVALPKLEALRAYVDSGLALGEPTLAAEAECTGDPELKRALGWSRAVNAAIDAEMPPVPPFANARRALELIRGASDAAVVSQTPAARVETEWREHGLLGCVFGIAGQEAGSKAEALEAATRGKYAPGRVLMIGDAYGDLDAARAAGALFYPISPGAEEASWLRFQSEAWPRFLAGMYAGSYQDALLGAFAAALPDRPPWMGKHQHGRE